MEWNENECCLIGTVGSEPVFSHENHGEDYFRFLLRVERLSGAEDLLPVLVSRMQLESCGVHLEERLSVAGEVRSFNNRSGTGNRLVLSVFARALSREDTPDCNQVRLTGTLCKTPTYRRTPLGREICDLTLAVNRRYGRADYLPVISWGTVARYCARLGVGDMVRLEGRFQSRNYRKVVDGESVQRTAYEVSVMRLEQISPT